MELMQGMVEQRRRRWSDAVVVSGSDNVSLRIGEVRQTPDLDVSSFQERLCRNIV